MSQQTDQLTQINRRQRQKMLLLIKNRTQNTMNRPSPLSTTRPQQKQPSIPAYDLIKQYQSNKTSQPDHSSSMGQIDKSIDYNSTLFKYLKQQSNIGNQASQFINNGSAISVRSEDVLNNIQSNQLLKDNGLLNKIDQLLNTRKKNNNNGIKKVYEEYLQKKSMSNSSGFSNISVTSSNLSNLTQNKLKSNTVSAYSNLHKLKTIQQQKATITIDRQELDQRFNKNKNSTNKNTNTHTNSHTKPQKQKRQYNNHNSNSKSNNKPPLPSITAIERQKKKIKQTMQQIKKQQNYEFHDKDSLVLEFSDNQSQQCNTSNLQKSYQKDQKNNNSQQLLQKDKKIQRLNQEKNKLCKQLQDIQRQLQQLERQQEEDL